MNKQVDQIDEKIQSIYTDRWVDILVDKQKGKKIYRYTGRCIFSLIRIQKVLTRQLKCDGSVTLV